MRSLALRVRRLGAHFLLRQRRRHRRLVLEKIAGVDLVVLPDVFHPGLFFSSELLAEIVGREPLDGKLVLEVGTGTGLLALLAARRARHTIGSDINPEAVRALKINALLNHLEDKVEARHGDLFAAVAGERFDVIIFNPPFFAGEAKDLWEHAWRDVNRVRARFVAEAAHFLRPGGRILVVDSSIAADRLDEAFRAAGFEVTPLGSRAIIPGELLTVFAASPSLSAAVGPATSVSGAAEPSRNGLEEFRIRAARQEDSGQLLALHERVFARPLSREQRDWKLASRDLVNNIWVAETEGRIVFQYAGIPVRFWHRGRQTWAMQSVDTMTDPAYRRRGLLTKTAAATFESWKQAGMAFVFGVPNQNWGKRLAALGFQQIGEVSWWVRWLDPLRALAAKIGLPQRSQPGPSRRSHSGSVRTSFVDDPTPFDDLWARTSDEGVIKDAAWFRWRFQDGPQPFQLLGAWNGNQLTGGAAFRSDGDSGIVGEVHATDIEVARALLARSCDELRAAGAARAALLIQPRSLLEEAALACGFLPRPHGFSVQAADLGGGLPRAALFQGGDFDVV